MRSFILVIFVTMLLQSCAVTKQTAPTIIYRDSIRVEYRERIVHDSVDVQLPDVLQERTTPDTVSVLQNAYARTTAVVHDGLLSHDLQTFPQIIRIPVTYPVHELSTWQKNTVNRTVTEYIEIEKKLTGWQRFWIRSGQVLWCIVMIAIIIVIASIPLGRKA